MVRTKRLERIPKTVNIDNDLNEILTKEYPGQASDLINQALRDKITKEKGKAETLIGSDTSAGRLAYVQAMEKIGMPSNISWKSLSQEEQLKFLDIYRKRLVDLQARGL